MEAAIRRGIRLSGLFLFLGYLTGLIYFLFFAESYGRGLTEAVYDYNLLPFREIHRYLCYRKLLGVRLVTLNLVGNVVGFLPFGALVPLLSRSMRKAWRIGLLSMEISALIEGAQFLFGVGCCDVDDVILNTVGGLLGYAVYRAADRLYSRMRIGRRTEFYANGHEPTHNIGEQNTQR